MPCTPALSTFQIAFYEDNAGMPGTQLSSFDVDPGFGTDTGTTFDTGAGLAPVLSFSATLSAPVSLSSGWISVYFTGDLDCWFLWGLSDAGDWSLYHVFGGMDMGDLAFCLSPAAASGCHTSDQNCDHLVNLSELLRVIQFFNSDGYHCQAGTEDGYNPGPGDHTCTPHNSDYNPQDWHVDLSELLRDIQFFNSGGYHYCPSELTEDGYCPGP